MTSRERLLEIALRSTLSAFTDERGDGVLRASIKADDKAAIEAWLDGDDSLVNKIALLQYSDSPKAHPKCRDCRGTGLVERLELVGRISTVRMTRCWCRPPAGSPA